jgi:hypothetical protein
MAKQKIIPDETPLLFIEEQKGNVDKENEELSFEWKRVPYFDLLGNHRPYAFDFFSSERAEVRWIIKRCYFWGS